MKMISQEDGQNLLKLARNSIESNLLKIEIDSNLLQKVQKFNKNQGVFVTIHKNSELRGCIGYPEPIFPLFQAIIDAAKSAAFKDPRFPPLNKSELKQINLEISVLTVPELIQIKNALDYKKLIKIGTDGLIIRSNYGSGLLLPQVPVEQNWDIDQYLNYICLKAGLPNNAWTNLNNKLYKFQAEIFSE